MQTHSLRYTALLVISVNSSTVSLQNKTDCIYIVALLISLETPQRPIIKGYLNAYNRFGRKNKLLRSVAVRNAVAT